VSHVDYHCHTRYSGDGLGEIRDLCVRAVELGITEIAITEHVDTDPTDPCYEFYDHEAVGTAVRRCREEFGRTVGVRHGIEIDYQKRFHDEAVEFLATHEFDVVLGSAHYIRGKRGWETEVYRLNDERSAYMGHFEGTLAAAESGLFDVMCHLDLVKRYGIPHYGPYDRAPYAAIIDEILRVMVDKDQALEVNTSGLRQTPQATFPEIETVRRYRELGGQFVTLGSDCHKPADLGAGLAEGADIIRRAGFTRLTVFEGRERSFVEL